jgi:hypothetical protein
MHFNPSPTLNLFVVVYTDHRMALCNGWSAALIHKQAISVVAGLRSASCSPDGRTLATIIPLAISGSGVLSRSRFYTI